MTNATYTMVRAVKPIVNVFTMNSPPFFLLLHRPSWSTIENDNMEFGFLGNCCRQGTAFS